MIYKFPATYGPFDCEVELCERKTRLCVVTNRNHIEIIKAAGNNLGIIVLRRLGKMICEPCYDNAKMLKETPVATGFSTHFAPSFTQHPSFTQQMNPLPNIRLKCPCCKSLHIYETTDPITITKHYVCNHCELIF